MASLADCSYQQFIFWGGDRVVTTQDVRVKKRVFVPKGTEFRVELSTGKITAAGKDKILLVAAGRKRKPGSWLLQTETVEIPAMYLRRVLNSNDYPTGYGSSLSTVRECSGGMFRSK